MGILGAVASAVTSAAKTVASAVTGGNKSSSSNSSSSGNKSSSSNSSSSGNKSSSSNSSSSSGSSNKGQSFSSTANTMSSTARANRTAAIGGTSSSGSSSSGKTSSSGSSSSGKTSTSNASVGAGSVAGFSSSPSIGGVSTTSTTNRSSSSGGGSSSSSNKSSSSGGSSSSSSKSSGSSGGSSSKSSSGGSSSNKSTVASNGYMSYNYTQNNANGSPAVATMSDGSIRYADGTTYNPSTGKTGTANKSSSNVITPAIGANLVPTIGTTTVSAPLSTTTRTSTSSGGGGSNSRTAGSTVIGNGYKSWDYTKNNESGSQAVMTYADGRIGYADGSTYDPKTGKTTASTKATSLIKNPIATGVDMGFLSNSLPTAPTAKKYDYTKENANGSPAVASMADGSIKYADGSVYNPKTGETTQQSTGQTIRDTTQGTQVTEDIARAEANERSNNAATGNSSTYNNVSTNGGNSSTSTNNRTNQSALSMVLGSQNNGVNLQTDSLDTGTTRNLGESQEASYQNGDGTETYIAPNGKQYTIAQDDNGNWCFLSSDGTWKNLQDGAGNIINDTSAIQDYIRDNNQVDGINRNNVDNKDAVKGATIEGTYTAPSGKEYDILVGKGNNEGKYGFVNINGDAQWFDTQEAALNYIDRNNPVGNRDLAKNTPKPEWQNNVSDVIEDMNEEMEEREEQDELDLEQLKQEWFEERENNQDESDDIYNQKQQIVNQMFNDIETFDRDIDDAIDDLKQKSELLQDNERMRRARQRAAELAAQGYLTSEQVAQVANYSLSDYNKELEANALEAAKAIAELRVSIAQKKQDYLAAARAQQYASESDRQTQLNYISERFDKMLQYINNKETEVSQFYGQIYNNNLAMNAENELGYESIVKQNDAQNIVNDRNQQRAFTDTEYRRQYILNNISDANLHAYAEKAINYLISQGNFIKPGLSNAQNKSLLADQISKITAAAKQLQLEDQKALQ